MRARARRSDGAARRRAERHRAASRAASRAPLPIGAAARSAAARAGVASGLSSHPGVASVDCHGTQRGGPVPAVAGRQRAGPGVGTDFFNTDPGLLFLEGFWDLGVAAGGMETQHNRTRRSLGPLVRAR